MELARRLFDRVRNFLSSLLLFFFGLFFFYSRGGEKILFLVFSFKVRYASYFSTFEGTCWRCSINNTCFILSSEKNKVPY